MHKAGMRREEPLIRCVTNSRLPHRLGTEGGQPFCSKRGFYHRPSSTNKQYHPAGKAQTARLDRDGWREQQGTRSMIRGLENMTYTESSKEPQLLHLKAWRLTSVVTVFKRKGVICSPCPSWTNSNRFKLQQTFKMINTERCQKAARRGCGIFVTREEVKQMFQDWHKHSGTLNGDELLRLPEILSIFFLLFYDRKKCCFA